MEMNKIREEMSHQFNQVMYAIKHNPSLTNIKPEALIRKKFEYLNRRKPIFYRIH